MACQQQILACKNTFHKNLQNHAILVKPKNPSSGRYGMFGKLIFIDLTTNSRIHVKGSISVIACNECVHVWFKLKDMMFCLLRQLVFSKYMMLRTCRLFVARIYANSWSWRQEEKFLAYTPCNEDDCHDWRCLYGNHSNNIQRRGLIQSKDSLKSNMQICNMGNSIYPQITNKVKGSPKRKRGKAEKRISLKDLEPFFSGCMMEAARCLGVSRSTLKRKCRQLGISQWPSSKGSKRHKNVPTSAHEPEPTHLRSISSNQTITNIQKPYQPSLIDQQSLGLFPDRCNTNSANFSDSSKNHRFCSSAPAKIIGEQSEQITNLTVKAIYRGDMIRFNFMARSSVMDLKREVGVRLNLKLGTFKVKYLDDDGEWALLAWDDDWNVCVWISRSSQRNNVVRLLVQDV